jgi:hypothetical protein
VFTVKFVTGFVLPLTTSVAPARPTPCGYTAFKATQLAKVEADDVGATAGAGTGMAGAARTGAGAGAVAAAAGDGLTVEGLDLGGGDGLTVTEGLVVGAATVLMFLLPPHEATEIIKTRATSMAGMMKRFFLNTSGAVDVGTAELDLPVRKVVVAGVREYRGELVGLLLGHAVLGQGVELKTGGDAVATRVAVRRVLIAAPRLQTVKTGAVSNSGSRWRKGRWSRHLSAASGPQPAHQQAGMCR